MSAKLTLPCLGCAYARFGQVGPRCACHVLSTPTFWRTVAQDLANQNYLVQWVSESYCHCTQLLAVGRLDFVRNVGSRGNSLERLLQLRKMFGVFGPAPCHQHWSKTTFPTGKIATIQGNHQPYGEVHFKVESLSFSPELPFTTMFVALFLDGA